MDGFDEAVPEMTLPGLLSLFAEVAQVLSAESAAVLATRVSFLEDSPPARRLLDGTSLMPEKLAQQLHAHGVNPQRVPRFSILHLHDHPTAGSLLAAQIRRQVTERLGTIASQAVSATAEDANLADLLWRYLGDIACLDLLPRVISYLGLAFLQGQTVFSLVDLVNGLGVDAFSGGHVDISSFRLRDLFRSADPASRTLAMRHAAYQEILAAEYLRTSEHRDTALALACRPRLTEEVRSFLYLRSRPENAAKAAPAPDDCVVPAGVYLVGPSHQLMLRRIARPFLLDRFPVTVARYRAFLDQVSLVGSAEWDHPDTPAGHSHEPRRDQLPVPDYYVNPAYAAYPAVAISWWSACAFARAEGKRLPSSLEWEAAGRGFDGRLFPWGDDVDVSLVNCADTWSDHPLITYDAWRAERARGGLADALPDPVDAHPGNASPFGVRELGGNVWEWTATMLDDPDEAVICGGSFSNPYRAVQASSKGSLDRQDASDAVGFRCAEDMP
jgi:formylglycine-generating enzyme required for sulfatase activity